MRLDLIETTYMEVAQMADVRLKMALSIEQPLVVRIHPVPSRGVD